MSPLNERADGFPSPFSGSLGETGSLPSIVGPSVVGLMRRLALTGALMSAAGASTLAYAHWESKRPILRRVSAEIPARPGLAPLRILHISDLHMYPGQNFIKKFLAKVAREEPIDLVVSTGDNLGAVEGLDELMEALEPLLDYPGAFVFGSNDYYSPRTRLWTDYLRRGRDDVATKHHRRNEPDLPWLELVRQMREAGWVDLSNRADSLTVGASATPVALVGVDDPHIRRDRLPTPPAEWLDPAAVRVGLTHAPYLRVVDPMIHEGADLVCAGHTHGGQVRVPGVGAVVTNSDLPARYARGLHPWGPPKADGGNAWLNVSAGLGTSPSAQIRFACRPEATLITLLPADK